MTEMVLRALFGTSTQIAEEYSGYFCAGAILFGAAEAFAGNHHIRADIILNRIPMRWRYRLEMAVTAVALGCAGYLLLGLGQQWLDTWTYQSQSFHPSRTLLWIPMAMPLLGVSLLFLQIFLRLTGSNETRDEHHG
jgi:TRAP-type C4-dicarboxylate transport system permease small subunit